MRFPCSRRYAARARRALVTYLTSIEADPRLQSELVTAVGEAIANALEHAYPDAHFFEVRCSMGSDAIVAEVEDDGSGFRGDAVPPGPGMTRGFGFGIMRSLVDELHILKNGKLVRFTKRLHRDAREAREAEGPRASCRPGS